MVIAFFMAVQFSLRRSDKGPLWLAVFCLVIIARTVRWTVREKGSAQWFTWVFPFGKIDPWNIVTVFVIPAYAQCMLIFYAGFMILMKKPKNPSCGLLQFHLHKSNSIIRLQEIERSTSDYSLSIIRKTSTLSMQLVLLILNLITTMIFRIFINRRN